jgi:hypothetical protein
MLAANCGCVVCAVAVSLALQTTPCAARKITMSETTGGQRALKRKLPQGFWQASTCTVRAGAICIRFRALPVRLPSLPSPRPPPPPQVVFSHGGQEHEVQPLVSAEEAGLVCDLLTRE